MKKYILIIIALSILPFVSLKAQLEGGFLDANNANKLRAIDFDRQFISDIIEYNGRIFAFGKGVIFNYNPADESTNVLVGDITANSGEFVGVFSVQAQDVLLYNLYDQDRRFIGSAYTPLGSSSSFNIGNGGPIETFIPRGQGYFIENRDGNRVLSTGGILESTYTIIREVFAPEEFKYGYISSGVLFFVDYKSSSLSLPVLYKINTAEEGGLATASNVTELFTHDLTVFNDAAVFVSDSRDLTTASGEKGEDVKVLESDVTYKNLFTFGNDFFCAYQPEEQQIFVFDPNYELVNRVGELGSDGKFLQNGVRNVLKVRTDLAAIETQNSEVLIVAPDFSQLNPSTIITSEYPLHDTKLIGKRIFLYTRSNSSPAVEEGTVLDINSGEILWQFKFEIPVDGYSVHQTAALTERGVYHAAANAKSGFELFIYNQKGIQVAEEIFNTDYEQQVLEQLNISEVRQEFSTFPKRIVNANGTLYVLSHLQMPLSYTNAEAQDAGFNTAVRDMNFLYKLNEQPNNLGPASFAVDENSSVGTAIGNLAASDPDDSDLNFRLVSGSGSADNAKVNVSGNQLTIAQIPDHEADAQWSIRVEVRDPHGDSRSRSISISVNDLNDAPDGISLTSQFVSETLPSGEAVAGIEAIDEDEVDNFTYALVASTTNPGVADADNGSFTIADSVLLSNTTFDASVKSEYNITLQVTDQGGQTAQQAFVITITDQNEVPSDISLDSNTISENLTERTLVGTLDTQDADPNQDNDDSGDIDFTYALVSGNGDDNNASFEISGDSLFAISAFDFESDPDLSVRIQTTDPLNATFAKAFSIAVTDANDAPTGITITNDSIDENQSSGTVVGVLDGQDPDATDSFSFDLIDATNYPDNNAFAINTNELTQANNGFDFEGQSLYQIKIQLTDKGGQTIDSVLSIHIRDINDPPNDITLSGLTVNEETPNAIAGQLNVDDQDAADSHNFSLPADSAANNLFQIITGNALAVAEPLNFEALNDPFYEVFVVVSDISGAEFTKTFQIEVLDINDAVDTLVMKRTTVKGGLSFEEKVSNIELRDEDISNNIINFYSRDDYTLLLADNTNYPDNANFQIAYLTNDEVYALESAVDLDFVAGGDNSYTINIEAINNGDSYFQEFTIELVSEGANTPPTEISISSDSILDIATAGTEVGVLSSQDDAGDTHTYSLVNNTINNDNEIFSISGDQLILEANIQDSTQLSYVASVISTDNGGLSLQEEINLYVKEFVDTTPPEIAGIVGGDRSFQEDATSFDLNGTVTDDAFLESVELEYGPVTSLEFTQKDVIELSGDNFTGSIPSDQGDAFGLKARVLATDTAGNIASSDTVYFYRSVSSSGPLAELPTERIGKGKKSNDYRMFSVPYTIQSGNRSIRDIFERSLNEAYAAGNFKVYQWNPEKEAYDEFLSIGSIEAGEAYWFSTVVEDASINFGEGEVFPYKIDNKAIWTLRAGWNQIGNPYPVAIDWNTLQAANPGLGDLYIFEGEGYTRTTTLNPHQGGFVLVEENLSVAADVNAELTSSRLAKKVKPTEDAMALNLQLSQGELKAEGGVGMNQSASDGLDPWDQANPPALGEFVEISFSQPESVWGNFRLDVVQEKAYYVWDFSIISSRKDRLSTLSWDPKNFLKGQLYLVDMETLHKIDITKQSEYKFRTAHKREFKLIYDKYATERFNLGSLLIGDPYPNPISKYLFIPINIAENNQTSVKLRVMDLNGKIIGEKFWNSGLEKGYQTIRVTEDELINQKGGTLRSGMYIYKIQVEEGDDTIIQSGRLIKH